MATEQTGHKLIVGVVKELNGKVVAVNATGEVRTLKVGDGIYADEKLVSSGDSKAIIEFSNGSQCVINDNVNSDVATLLKLNSQSTEPDNADQAADKKTAIEIVQNEAFSAPQCVAPAQEPQDEGGHNFVMLPPSPLKGHIFSGYDTIPLAFNFEKIIRDVPLTSFKAEALDQPDGVVTAVIADGAVYEDGMPNQYIGDYTVHATPIVINLIPSDNEQLVSITFHNIPAGAVLSDGVTTITGNGSNSFTVLAANISHLNYLPSANSDVDQMMDFTAVIRDPNSGLTKNLTGTLDLPYDAVADKPIDNHALVSDTAFTAGTEVPIQLSAAFGDTDGSEKNYFLVELPEGWTAPEGSTLVAGADLPAGITSGTYIKLDVTNYHFEDGPLIINLTAPMRVEANTDYAIKVYAIAKEENLSGVELTTDNNIAVSEVSTVTVAVAPRFADLQIIKDVSNETPDVGDNITFTLTVKNLAGTVTAQEVKVEDFIPQGLEIDQNTLPNGVFYDSSTGQLVWDIGSLAVGASRTLEFTTKVTSNFALENGFNEATVSSSTSDPNLSNNKDDAPVDPKDADLALDKSVDNATPNVNDTITFTLSVNNQGSDAAQNVVVTDILPEGLVLKSALPENASYDEATRTLTWNIGNLASGSHVSIDFSTEVTKDFALEEGFNEATVTSTTYDVNLDNNHDKTPIDPQDADLAIEKTIDKTAPNVGEEVVYTIKVTNNGSDTAHNVTVNDLLPEGLSYISSSDAINYDPTTGLWNIGNLMNGQTVELQITAKIASIPQTVLELDNTTMAAYKFGTSYIDVNGKLNLTAANGEVTFTNNGSGVKGNAGFLQVPDQIGHNPDNNQSEALAVNLGKIVNSATITVSNMFLDENDNDGEYGKVSLYDAAGNEVNSFIFGDFEGALVAGLNNFIAVNYSNNNVGSFTVAANSGFQYLVFTALPYGAGIIDNSINPDNDSSDYFVKEINYVVVDPIINKASVGATTYDTNLDNNNSEVSTQPQSADLSLYKVVNNTLLVVGEEFTYTIQVYNSGASSAQNVTVSEQLPSGLILSDFVASQGTYANGIWTIGTMTPGQIVKLTVKAVANEEGAYTNTAQVATSSTFDPDSTPGNNNPNEDDQSSVVVYAAKADTPTINMVLAGIGPNNNFIKEDSGTVELKISANTAPGSNDLISKLSLTFPSSDWTFDTQNLIQANIVNSYSSSMHYDPNTNTYIETLTLYFSAPISSYEGIIELIPPTNSDTDFGSISATVTVKDSVNLAATAQAQASQTLNVDAVADTPHVFINVYDSDDANSTFQPGETGTMHIDGSFGDFKDGSETHVVAVKVPSLFNFTIPDNLPAGVTVEIDGQTIYFHYSSIESNGTGNFSLDIPVTNTASFANYLTFEVVAQAKENPTDNEYAMSDNILEAKAAVGVLIEENPLTDLNGKVVINEIGLGVSTKEVIPSFGEIAANQNFIELHNLNYLAIDNLNTKSLSIEILGANGNQVVTLNLSTATGEITIPEHGYLTLYESGQWTSSDIFGTIIAAGTYSSSAWGFGQDTSDKIAVNIVQSNNSIDLFVANNANKALLTDSATAWNNSTLASPAAIALMGSVIDNTTFNAAIGNQQALLDNLGIARPQVAGASITAQESNHIFARVFSEYESTTADTNTSADWTTSNKATTGVNNYAIGDINLQDSEDNLNPAQTAGVNMADAGQTVLNSNSAEGGRGPDFLYGTSADNVLKGEDHNDFLFGDAGDDQLYGNKGADLLVDVNGKDMLIGGTGNDILIADAAKFNNAAIPANDMGDLLVGDDITTAITKTYNIVFVMDVSGSMGWDFEGNTPQAGELSRLDIAKQAFKALLADIEAKGIAENTKIFVVPFSNPENDTTTSRIPQAFGTANDPAITSKIDSLYAAGATQYEGPLATAANWLMGNSTQAIQPTSNSANIIYFLSDGGDNDGYNSATPGVLPLYDGSIENLTIRAFGFGSAGSSDFRADELDEVVTGKPGINGSVPEFAEIVTDPSKLASALTAGGITQTTAGQDVIYGGNFNDIIFGDNLGVENQSAYNADPFGYVTSHLIDKSNPNYNEELLNLQHIFGENDWIDGGNGDDTIFGQGGDDQILGGTGNDTIYGGSGNDVIDDGIGNDFVYGNDGNDTFKGSLGNDKIDGGTGTDTMDYSSTTKGVTVNLTSGISTGLEIGTDTLSNIENAFGGSGKDYFVGTSSNNIFNGNAGIDTVDYSAATTAVTINLATGIATGAEIGTDTLISIENSIGGSGNDTLTGDNTNNILEGGTGADVLNGGAGNDTASYEHASAGVTANLTAGYSLIFSLDGDSSLPGVGAFQDEDLIRWNSTTNSYSLYFDGTAAGLADSQEDIDAIDILANGDLLFSTENGGSVAGISNFKGEDIIRWNGSSFSMYFHGSVLGLNGLGLDAFNVLSNGDIIFSTKNNFGGYSPSDLIRWNGSNFSLYFDGSDHSLNSSNENIDALHLLGNGDIIFSTSGNGNVPGVGNFADEDLIQWHSSTNTFTKFFDGSDHGLTGNIDAIYIDGLNTGDAAGDTYTSIENLTGSKFADTLQGNNSANILTGLAGNDLLIGLEGDDTLIGGAGSDTLIGGLGSDTFVFTQQDIGVNQIDTIRDFTVGIGGDALDLSNVLTGLSSAPTAAELDNYLNFSVSGGNTTISIDADGNGSGTDHTIILQGTALAGANDQAIITNLINQGNLDVTA